MEKVKDLSVNDRSLASCYVLRDAPYPYGTLKVYHNKVEKTRRNKMVKQSEQINELAAALAKAQGEMGFAKKTSENPFYKSKYADLAECLAACREPLSRNGLALTQPPTDYKDGMIEVTTVLLHASGQYIMSSCSFPLGKDDIQGVGSAITYARRYCLAAMIGLAQEDDDGNSNVEPPRKPAGRQIKMVKESNDGKTMADAGKKVDLHSGYGIHINGEAYVRLGGRDIPLSVMNRDQLVKVLEVPEWHEIHKDAREFIESIDRIESAMDA